MLMSIQFPFAALDISRSHWLPGDIHLHRPGRDRRLGCVLRDHGLDASCSATFRSEEEQDEFLTELEAPLAQGDFESAAELCDGDPRAVSQLALIAISHRDIGYAKVKHLVMDRFQRDVLSDLEQRLSWVNTVIKSAPMVGLFGTVVGMMGAFGKLAGAANVSPDVLAQDISVALITTASGLAIAIPLVLLDRVDQHSDSQDGGPRRRRAWSGVWIHCVKPWQAHQASKIGHGGS